MWLGGCSASFVLEDEFIITNHHCATGSLTYYSEPNANLYDDGFLAGSLGEELGGEPGEKAWVTQRITDVTDRVRGGLGKIEDPRERYLELEERVKAIVEECEEGRAWVTCDRRSPLMSVRGII